MNDVVCAGCAKSLHIKSATWVGTVLWCWPCLRRVRPTRYDAQQEEEMSKRMTNERLNDLARAGNTIACAQEADRARVAEQTLLGAVRAKDATIEALADALISTASVTDDDGPCWCGGVVEKKNGRHFDLQCVERRAALRLAGRL